MGSPKIRRRRISIDDVRAQLAAFEAAHPGAHAGNFPDVFRDERGELVETDEFFEISSLYGLLVAARAEA